MKRKIKPPRRQLVDEIRKLRGQLNETIQIVQDAHNQLKLRVEVVAQRANNATAGAWTAQQEIDSLFHLLNEADPVTFSFERMDAMAHRVQEATMVGGMVEVFLKRYFVLLDGKIDLRSDKDGKSFLLMRAEEMAAQNASDEATKRTG